MEEKANKLGKSWKEPGKKIKLVSRLSQSDVKDVKQEGMVHSRAFNKVVAPEKKSPEIIKLRLFRTIEFSYFILVNIYFLSSKLSGS